MKITLYFTYAVGCSFSERMEWEAELSAEQLRRFVEAKDERQQEFDDILDSLDDDESLEDNEEAMEQYMLLNYEILEKIYPDWCQKQKEEFIEDARANGDNEDLTADNVISNGFYIEDDDFLTENEYDFDFEEIKKNGIQVNLSYVVSMGRGDGGDECDWEATMTYDELQKYLAYKKERGSNEYLFEDMEEALPEWASDIYDEIADVETGNYRDYIDPDNDDYDEVMDDDWSITDNGSIYISFESFGEEEWD